MYFKTLGSLLVLFAPAAWADEAKVTVSRQDCARLVRHVPAADVAYQPGVGVKGRKVAPADLPGSGADMKVLPEVFEFTIAINPVGWGERITAQKAKSQAEAALAATIEGRLAASQTLTALQGQQATLTAAAAPLAADLVDLQADLTDLEADVTAYETAIANGTLQPWDRSYSATKKAVTAKQAEVDAKQAEVDANAAALATNAASQATQQAIVDASPATEDGYTAATAKAQSTLSSISARGLDEASMKVGTVTYDTLRGTFLFNGQPLGAAEMQDLAEACANRGVK